MNIVSLSTDAFVRCIQLCRNLLPIVQNDTIERLANCDEDISLLMNERPPWNDSEEDEDETLYEDCYKEEFMLSDEVREGVDVVDKAYQRFLQENDRFWQRHTQWVEVISNLFQAYSGLRTVVSKVQGQDTFVSDASTEQFQRTSSARPSLKMYASPDISVISSSPRKEVEEEPFVLAPSESMNISPRWMRSITNLSTTSRPPPTLNREGTFVYENNAKQPTSTKSPSAIPKLSRLPCASLKQGASLGPKSKIFLKNPGCLKSREILPSKSSLVRKITKQC